MEHSSRRRWCAEISAINRELKPSKNQSKEKSILDMKPNR